MKRLSRKRSSSSVTDGAGSSQKENAAKQSRISSFFKKEPTLKMFTSIKEAVQNKPRQSTDSRRSPEKIIDPKQTSHAANSSPAQVQYTSKNHYFAHHEQFYKVTSYGSC